MPRKYERRNLDWSDPEAAAAYKRQYFQEHHTPGTIRPESGYAKEVTVNGVVYGSIAAAARALGISKQRLSVIVQQRGRDIDV